MQKSNYKKWSFNYLLIIFAITFVTAGQKRYRELKIGYDGISRKNN